MFEHPCLRMTARMSTSSLRCTAGRRFTVHYIIDKAAYAVPPKTVSARGPFGEIYVDSLFGHSPVDFRIIGPQPVSKHVTTKLQLFHNTNIAAAETALEAIRAAEDATVDGVIVEYQTEDEAWEACLDWFEPTPAGQILEVLSPESVKRRVFEFAEAEGVWPGHVTACITLQINFKQPAVKAVSTANTVVRMEDGFSTLSPVGMMPFSKFDIYDSSQPIDINDKIFVAVKPKAAAIEGRAAAMFKIEITHPEQQFSKSDYLKMQPIGFAVSPFVEIIEITNRPALLQLLWLAHGGVWVGGIEYKQLIYAADKFIMPGVLSQLIDMIEFTVPNIILIGDAIEMMARWEITKEGMRDRLDQLVIAGLRAAADGADLGDRDLFDKGLVKCLRSELSGWLKELVARGSFGVLFK